MFSPGIGLQVSKQISGQHFSFFVFLSFILYPLSCVLCLMSYVFALGSWFFALGSQSQIKNRLAPIILTIAPITCWGLIFSLNMMDEGTIIKMGTIAINVAAIPVLVC